MIQISWEVGLEVDDLIEGMAGRCVMSEEDRNYLRRHIYSVIRNAMDRDRKKTARNFMDVFKHSIGSMA